MFSFAGVAKVLSDGLSIWTFADEPAGKKVHNEKGAADKDTNDPSEGQVTGREKWVKGSPDFEEPPVDDHVILAGTLCTEEVQTTVSNARDRAGSSVSHDCSSVSDFDLASRSRSNTTEKSAGEPSTTKKKKKKKRSRAQSMSSVKHVHWGLVDEIEFSRGLAFDRIPSDGVHPLGLGEEVGRATVSVDEKVSIQQSDLMRRAKELGMPLGGVAVTNPDGTTRLSPFETRQFDYKSGKNILFSRLTEHERIQALGTVQHGGKSSGSAPISEFVKEIKLIQTTRIETGCSCKPLKIDKLSVAKLKSELIRNDMKTEEINKLGKAELSSLLKEKLFSCRLCIDNNCICFEAGIPCSAGSCGCLSEGGIRNLAQSCNNTHGRTIFDSAVVDEYRSRFVPSLALKLRQKIDRRASF